MSNVHVKLSNRVPWPANGLIVETDASVFELRIRDSLPPQAVRETAERLFGQLAMLSQRRHGRDS